MTFDDGTEVTTFADSEYTTYSSETGCATVDNAANTVSVAARSDCSSVTVAVSVTVAGVTMQDSVAIPVTSAVSMTTSMDAYPGGSSSITSLYHIPCTSSFERGLLARLRHASVGAGPYTTDVTSLMSYAPDARTPA